MFIVEKYDSVKKEFIPVTRCTTHGAAVAYIEAQITVRCAELGQWFSDSMDVNIPYQYHIEII